MKIRKANKRDLPLVINILRRKNLPHEDIPSRLDCMFIAHSGGGRGNWRGGDFGEARAAPLPGGEGESRGKGFGKT